MRMWNQLLLSGRNASGFGFGTPTVYQLIYICVKSLAAGFASGRGDRVDGNSRRVGESGVIDRVVRFVDSTFLAFARAGARSIVASQIGFSRRCYIFGDALPLDAPALSVVDRCHHAHHPTTPHIPP